MNNYLREFIIHSKEMIRGVQDLDKLKIVIIFYLEIQDGGDKLWQMN
jgi:hypothetical protein